MMRRVSDRLNLLIESVGTMSRYRALPAISGFIDQRKKSVQIVPISVGSTTELTELTDCSTVAALGRLLSKQQV